MLRNSSALINQLIFMIGALIGSARYSVQEKRSDHIPLQPTLADITERGLSAYQVFSQGSVPRS